jgi:hypothetical protein
MSQSPYDPSLRPDYTLGAPPPAPAARILRIGPERITVWICTDAITHVVIHHVAPRTYGCRVVHGTPPCPFCAKGIPTRWAHWLQVSLSEGAESATYLCAVTQGALESEPHLLAADGYLWGRRLSLWRYPPAPGSPMYAELDVSISPRDLPRVEPTMHHLIRLWQAKTSAAVLKRHQSAPDGKSLGGTEGEA